MAAVYEFPISCTLAKEQQDRWRQEASFFDKFVSETEVAPIDQITLARYQGPLRRRFSKEFRLCLLGDLRGKTVLDVGCGEGTNSILLAKLGAQVTGIDISPKSIELAGKRAEINQVSGSCRLLCSPLETADLEPESFDIIWGDAILHHVIADLANVLSRLTRWAKPGALMVFGEPVNFNQTLRRIRFLVPVKTDVSPDATSPGIRGNCNSAPLSARSKDAAIRSPGAIGPLCSGEAQLRKIALGAAGDRQRLRGLGCDGAGDPGDLAAGGPRGFVRASSWIVS